MRASFVISKGMRIANTLPAPVSAARRASLAKIFPNFRQIVPGGQGGIRTHGEREPTPVFKTGALNHSATCPLDAARIADTRPWVQATRRKGMTAHALSCNTSSMWSYRIRAAIVLACLPLAAGAAVATIAAVQDDEGFEAFVAQLRTEALAQGVSTATIEAVIPTLYYSQRVVRLDRAQPGGPPNAPIPKFAPYAAQHVDNARISRGREKYQTLRPVLEKIASETGVPETILVAIWGHETNYGAYTGDFDLANSLATLAYEGRRRSLFTTEFIATLKMIDKGFPREKLKGSWAGATGYPQFLPSTYLRYGRDGDGDGRSDIWANEADALASIANYFAGAGWRSGQPWGVRAFVPNTLDRSMVESRLVPGRCPRVFGRHSQWKTLAEWRALGVTPFEGKGMRETDLATLLEPDGPGAAAYLLTGNYRVILEYNCSNFYALSVGLLADAVEK